MPLKAVFGKGVRFSGSVPRPRNDHLDVLGSTSYLFRVRRMEARSSNTEFPSVAHSFGVDFTACSKTSIIQFWLQPELLLLLPRASMVSLYRSVLWISGAGFVPMETHAEMNGKS